MVVDLVGLIALNHQNYDLKTIRVNKKVVTFAEASAIAFADKRQTIDRQFSRQRKWTREQKKKIVRTKTDVFSP